MSQMIKDDDGDASFVLKEGGENDDKARESGRVVEDTNQLPDHGEGSREVAKHGIKLPAPSSSLSSSSLSFSSSKRRK